MMRPSFLFLILHIVNIYWDKIQIAAFLPRSSIQNVKLSISRQMKTYWPQKQTSETSKTQLNNISLSPSYALQTPLISSPVASDNLDNFQILENNLKKEIGTLKSRLDNIEKTVATVQSSIAKTSVGNFVDSLAAGTIELNPKTIEVFSMISFFLIGSIIGTSLLDRLWLLGGIIGAWWASGAIYRDTRGGLLARRIGVQVTQLVRDIQEKYNQAIIFYRTGKLAYTSKKIWDQFDEQYAVQKRVDEFKRLAMKRATEFNTAFQEYHMYDQVTDAWNAMLSVPNSAAKIDEEYKISSSLNTLGKNFINTVGDFVFGVDKSSDPPAMTRRAPIYAQKHPLVKRIQNIHQQFRGKRVVNPWGTPFKGFKYEISDEYLANHRLAGRGRGREERRGTDEIKNALWFMRAFRRVLGRPRKKKLSTWDRILLNFGLQPSSAR